MKVYSAYLMCLDTYKKAFEEEEETLENNLLITFKMSLFS